MKKYTLKETERIIKSSDTKARDKVQSFLYNQRKKFLKSKISSNIPRKEAEEIFSESFLALLDMIYKGFEKDGDILKYFWGILRNKVSQYNRKKKYIAPISPLEEFIEDDEDILFKLRKHQNRLEVISKLESELDEDCYKIIRMRTIEDKKHKQIAKILNITETHSSNKYNNCLKKAKKICLSNRFIKEVAENEFNRGRTI